MAENGENKILWNVIRVLLGVILTGFGIWVWNVADEVHTNHDAMIEIKSKVETMHGEIEELKGHDRMYLSQLNREKERIRLLCEKTHTNCNVGSRSDFQ